MLSRLFAITYASMLACFLMACGHLAADVKSQRQVTVSETDKKITIKKGEKQTSFSLDLPKGFEVESVFKQSHKNLEVIAYQYSNGEEAAAQIQVIDSESLKKLWQKQIPGFNLSQPLIKDGAIYFAVVDYVAKFDLNSGKVLWEKEGVNASHDFIGSDKIEIKNGVVHFSEKLKISDGDGKFIGGSK